MSQTAASSPKDVYNYGYSLWERYDGLEPVSLDSHERQAMGGHLFPEAPYFLHLLVAGMREEPELFKGYPVHAEGLEWHQEQAHAWKFVRDSAARILQFANDGYLFHQSLAICQGQMVLQQVEAEGKLPFGAAAGHEQRRQAVLGAILMMGDRKKSLVNKAKQARKKKEGDEETKPAKSGGGTGMVAELLQEKWAEMRSKQPAAPAPEAAPAAARPPRNPPNHEEFQQIDPVGAESCGGDRVQKWRTILKI